MWLTAEETGLPIEENISLKELEDSRVESTGSWIFHNLHLPNQMGSSQTAPAGSPAAWDAVGELLPQRQTTELAVYLYLYVALRLEDARFLS